MARKAQVQSTEEQNTQAQAEPQEAAEKPVRYYSQRKPNDEVRKEAALKYIEDKTRPRKKKGNFPNSDAACSMEPGDNSKYVAFGMKIFNLDPIDLCSEEQVKARISDYLRICYEEDMKPGIAGMAMALGVDRHRLMEIKGGSDRSSLPAGCRAVIKRAYDYIEVYWESIMQSGKINPASGIFLGKNHFGYKDQSEMVLTPNARLSEQTTPAELQKRIAALPDD